MRRLRVLALMVIAGAALGDTAVEARAAAPPASASQAAAQAPAQIQNGRVETRPATAIAEAVTSLGAGDEPVWIAWRVPMVAGDRSECSTTISSGWVWHGAYLGDDGLRLPPPAATAPPASSAPAARQPVALESGTGLVVVVRVLNRQIERIRRYSDDCPLDAGGRTVYWLTGITPAESLRFLEGALTRGALTPALQRTLAASALSAISLHGDPGADAILDRLATGERDSELRKQAISKLASDRGAHGFEMVRRLLASETAPDLRVSLTEALGRTQQPQTADALLALARTDTSAGVRRAAAHWYPQRAGLPGLDATLAIVNTDADDEVRSRALSGLGALPSDQIVPRLIELVRTSQNQRVRRESVAMLGRTKDPRAIAFLEELLRTTR